MNAYFSTVADDPELANVLWEVEGVTDAYAIVLPLGHYLVGAMSPTRKAADFNGECGQVIRDAIRVNRMLESCPDLVLDW